jgi:hypothetical protein
MEDWAYAASWDRDYPSDPVKPCATKIVYPREKFE